MDSELRRSGKNEEINEKKAFILYDYLDGSRLFEGMARKDSRSLMNITFRAGSDEVNAEFIKAAEQNGIICIGGHRTVGGMRASLYNAMPVEGVEYLVDFMRDFEARKLSGC